MLTLEQGIKVLSEELQNERLIAFVGSGISVDSGLPTWDGFLDSFIGFCRQTKKDYGRHPTDPIHQTLPEGLLANAEATAEQVSEEAVQAITGKQLETSSTALGLLAGIAIRN